MTILYLTRTEAIDDLSQTFKEQNDISEMSDTDLAGAWITHGTHAGTWDWDDVKINNLYYNADMGIVQSLADWVDAYDDEDFEAWKSEYLTDINDLPDCYEIDDLITPVLSDVRGKYLVVELDSEDTADFPYIRQEVWDEIENYDILFVDIQNWQGMPLASAVMQLKLLRGYSIPEIGYAGHRFIGYDGRIIRVDLIDEATMNDGNERNDDAMKALFFDPETWKVTEIEQ